jgi:hypothetical protein
MECRGHKAVAGGVEISRRLFFKVEEATKQGRGIGEAVSVSAGTMRRWWPEGHDGCAREGGGGGVDYC